MLTDTAFNGLNSALQEEPSLVLSFYSYGVLMRKRDGDITSEYAVNPQDIALALNASMRLNTGILHPDTLFITTNGVEKTVVQYRKAQMTGIYLDGAETALRIPLPALLLIRQTAMNQKPNYQLYAVKKRPADLEKTKLYHAPLPNVFGSGGICWGTVPTVTDEALADNTLTQDYKMLLGSPFGDHACAGKSRSHPKDIREKLVQLERDGAKRYPTRDLVEAPTSLKRLLGDDT
jgi:hypothetical protein